MKIHFLLVAFFDRAFLAAIECSSRAECVHIGGIA